jgi:hypothetical protein
MNDYDRLSFRQLEAYVDQVGARIDAHDKKIGELDKLLKTAQALEDGTFIVHKEDRESLISKWIWNLREALSKIVYG